jgi:hypothetical protein
MPVASPFFGRSHATRFSLPSNTMVTRMAHVEEVLRREGRVACLALRSLLLW